MSGFEFPVTLMFASAGLRSSLSALGSFLVTPTVGEEGGGLISGGGAAGLRPTPCPVSDAPPALGFSQVTLTIGEEGERGLISGDKAAGIRPTPCPAGCG